MKDTIFRLVLLALLGTLSYAWYEQTLAQTQLLRQAGVNNYVIMDTLVRLYHHTGRHPKPQRFCPECANVLAGRHVPIDGEITD